MQPTAWEASKQFVILLTERVGTHEDRMFVFANMVIKETEKWKSMLAMVFFFFNFHYQFNCYHVINNMNDNDMIRL